MNSRHIAVALAALLALGCSKKEESKATDGTTTAAATAAKPDPAREAKKVWKTKCIVCHGDSGAGDGPGAAGLDPKPRAFADAAWQTSITDENIKKVILEGGAGVGKSTAMAANPELKDKPEVLAELVKIVRGFKK